MINGRPFVFLGQIKQSRSRSRFDLAHELGHLVLHQHYSTDDLLEKEVLKRIESEANAFASAFLMPRDEILRDLQDVSLPALERLKPKWGTSIGAMVHRAKDLGLITSEKYTLLCADISSRGWRGRRPEPLEDQVPAINRTLAKKCFLLLQQELPSQAISMLGELPFPTTILADFFDLSQDQLYGPSPEAKLIYFPSTAQSGGTYGRS